MILEIPGRVIRAAGSLLGSDRSTDSERERGAEPVVLEPMTADELARTHTRAQLHDRAAELDVRGRSKMSKRELAEEIVKHQ